MIIDAGCEYVILGHSELQEIINIIRKQGGKMILYKFKIEIQSTNQKLFCKT